jgi:lipopolysaccharide assembly outer membrane protein LptD (OstA)
MIEVVFSDVTLYVGRTPIFWFPYVYQSLNKEQGFTITPGYTSKWGAFLLGNYTFPIGEGWSARVRLDLMADRGVGVGLESEWANGKAGRDWGRFRFYAIDDSNPGANETGLDREEIDPGRYRLSVQARQYITDDIYATVDINKLSDARFLEDFAEGEFRKNPNPDNAVSLTYWNEDFTGTLLYRQNLNDDNFDATERLPEGYFDVKRQPFFRTPIFYESETSAGFLRRNFADQSQFQDYDTVRADTFHQFTLPLMVKNVLSIVPRVGVRGTYYSDSGKFFDQTVTETVEETIFDEATGLTELAKREVTTTERVLRGGGSIFRPVVNAGVEMSFKVSKAYESVQSRAWGLDGLRHVVQPWLNLAYTVLWRGSHRHPAVRSSESIDPIAASRLSAVQHDRFDRQWHHSAPRSSSTLANAARQRNVELARMEHAFRRLPRSAGERSFDAGRWRFVFEYLQSHPLEPAAVAEP